MIITRALTKRYGAVEAVSAVDLDVREGAGDRARHEGHRETSEQNAAPSALPAPPTDRAHHPMVHPAGGGVQTWNDEVRSAPVRALRIFLADPFPGIIGFGAVHRVRYSLAVRGWNGSS